MEARDRRWQCRRAEWAALLELRREREILHLAQRSSFLAFQSKD